MTILKNTAARRGAALVAGAAVAALALSACSAQGGSSASTGTAIDWKMTESTAAPSGEIDSIKWAVYSEPYSLDYIYAFDYADNQVLANVCESLLRLNPDFTLSPGLAESFEHPDEMTWVYKIRSGVTFHDGSPLTAADAVASMQRHLDPELGSFWYSVYQNVASIEQTGDMEVTVKMAVPDSQFNLGMGHAAGVIESASTLEALGADYGNSTGGVNCTGPFQFDSWESGENIKLSPFDGYWDESLKAKSKSFEFVFMGDTNARANALMAGEVDGSWMAPLDSAQKLMDSGKGDLLFGLNTTVSSLIVSNLEGPLGDVRVRKALLMALDRENMNIAARSGIGEITDVQTTESVWSGASDAARTTAFEDIEHYEFNIEEAKKLIKEAGVEGEKIVYASAPLDQSFTVNSQAVVAAAKAIGLDAEIKTLTPSAYTTLFSDPSAREGIDLFQTEWYLSAPDALEMYSVLRTGEFSNYGNWSNEEFDQIVTEAAATDDAAARSELTARAQQIVNEELPWLPLSTPPTAVFMGERITGLSPSINFMYYPWAATLGAR